MNSHFLATAAIICFLLVAKWSFETVGNRTAGAQEFRLFYNLPSISDLETNKILLVIDTIFLNFKGVSTVISIHFQGILVRFSLHFYNVLPASLVAAVYFEEMDWLLLKCMK